MPARNNWPVAELGYLTTFTNELNDMAKQRWLQPNFPMNSAGLTIKSSAQWSMMVSSAQ